MCAPMRQKFAAGFGSLTFQREVTSSVRPSPSTMLSMPLFGRAAEYAAVGEDAVALSRGGLLRRAELVQALPEVRSGSLCVQGLAQRLLLPPAPVTVCPVEHRHLAPLVGGEDADPLRGGVADEL